MLSAISQRCLVHAVDSIPTTRGMAILVIDSPRDYWLRRLHDAHTRTVIFRVMYPQQKSALAAELVSLGFNAVGTGCAWVGAFAFSAAAPISGGASAPVAYVSAAAAGAGTVQTFASGWRVYNELTDNHAANAAQDGDPYYQWTMRSCDVLQLVSAGAALKSAWTAGSNLQKAQIPISNALKGLSKNQAINLADVARVGYQEVRGARTALAVRQQILGSFSSVLSGISSASGGVINEISVGLAGPV